MTLSDPQLVIGVARWDADALAELYARHGRAVYGVARRLCGPDASSGVTEDVFLRFWSRAEGVDPTRGSLRSHLIADVYARAVEVVHVQGAPSKRGPTSAAARPRRTPHLTPHAGDDAPRDEVDGLIAQLEDGEREAIVLTFFGGQTYREIVELLEQSECTVKSWIRAGLSRIHSLVGAPGETERPPSKATREQRAATLEFSTPAPAPGAAPGSGFDGSPRHPIRRRS